MPPYAQTLTYIFALCIVLMQVGMVVVVGYRYLWGHWVPRILVPYVQQYALATAAMLAVAALVLSLWYSEIIGIPVCPLCWFARTMMYPLAIMLPIAAWKKDLNILPYIYALTGVGALITGYHHLLQVGVVSEGICDALQNGGTCMARYVFEFGYVTMPLFGFTLFCAIALMLYVSRRV